MGLDFVVLNRPDDDSQSNWPGHEVDARRADDPSPEVLNALKESYSKQFSPEGIAASAKFRGWPRITKPSGVVGWIFLPLGIVVAYPVRVLRALAAKREDARRRIEKYSGQ